MQLVVTLMTDTNKVDFQINNEMKIRDALKIIGENSGLKISKSCKFVYSHRKQENVSINYTFKEAEIFSGDCLKVEVK